MYAMADDRLSADRGRAIEAALANIEKKFGKGSIMRLGERDVSDIPAISTTSLSLDAAVGIGGVPRGRIVEIYGPESSGKTTLALHLVCRLLLEKKKLDLHPATDSSLDMPRRSTVSSLTLCSAP